MKVEIEVSNDHLFSAIVSAVEGGINYWCTRVEGYDEFLKANPMVDLNTPRREEIECQNFQNWLDGGGKLTFYDERVKTYQPCDACGRSTGEDSYCTDDEVCQGGDGPGFFLCNRKDCMPDYATLTVEQRRARYTRRPMVTTGGKPYVLDAAAMQKSLHVLGKLYAFHLKDLIMTSGDSTTGDVFVQCGIFGDIRYC